MVFVLITIFDLFSNLFKMLKITINTYLMAEQIAYITWWRKIFEKWMSKKQKLVLADSYEDMQDWMLSIANNVKQLLKLIIEWKYDSICFSRNTPGQITNDPYSMLTEEIDPLIKKAIYAWYAEQKNS